MEIGELSGRWSDLYCVHTHRRARETWCGNAWNCWIAGKYGSSGKDSRVAQQITHTKASYLILLYLVLSEVSASTIFEKY